MLHADAFAGSSGDPETGRTTAGGACGEELGIDEVESQTAYRPTRATGVAR